MKTQIVFEPQDIVRILRDTPEIGDDKILTAVKKHALQQFAASAGGFPSFLPDHSITAQIANPPAKGR
jgi:hypothetical protein